MDIPPQPIKSNEAAAELMSVVKNATIQSSLLNLQADGVDSNYEKCDNYCNLETHSTKSNVTTAVSPHEVDVSTPANEDNAHNKDEIVKTETTNYLLNLVVRLTRASINFSTHTKSKEDPNELKQNGETIPIWFFSS